MELYIFSVFDVKSGAYAPPFAAKSPAVGIRDFMEACKDPQSLLNKYPDDFRLFQVGKFDLESGFIVGETAPIFLCDGRNVLGDGLREVKRDAS